MYWFGWCAKCGGQCRVLREPTDAIHLCVRCYPQPPREFVCIEALEVLFAFFARLHDPTTEQVTRDKLRQYLVAAAIIADGLGWDLAKLQDASCEAWFDAFQGPH